MIKTTRYHFTLIKWLNLERLTILNIDEDVQLWCLNTDEDVELH